MTNKKFINPHQKKTKRTLFHYLLWQFGFYNEKAVKMPLPTDFIYPNRREVSTSPYKLTWINHSTFLIECDGVTFLTDPIFTTCFSPFPFIGPKRQHQPKPTLEDLAHRVDVVLISHNHYDHVDKKSLKKLQRANPSIQWIVPLGLKSWFEKKLQAESIFELDWYKEVSLTKYSREIRCTAVPAQHFSGRGLFDANCSLWMGVVVEMGEKRFYFAGDTGYNEVDFKEIGGRYKKMDLSLLPIGIYTPRPFMRSVHINPEEAVIIHKEVHSVLSVGGHWKTFQLATHEESERPPFDLYCALQKEGLSPEVFRVLEPGQTISW